MQQQNQQPTRDYLSIIGPVVVLSLLGFFAAYQFVDPAPPKMLTIATARKDGAYYQFALKYRDLLKHQGITLKVLETPGSVANLKLLRTRDNGVNVAFVQGGTASDNPGAGLQSIASLYFEPLWVFYRARQPLASLGDARGRRVAIGAPGSGTRAIASQLLKLNGIATDRPEILPLGGRQAAEALLDGSLDAAFFVASPQSPTVRALLNSPSVGLLNFQRAEAYTRIQHFLSSVTLPRGAIDLARDLPNRDIRLLAATANLVATPDLHPALIDLLLQAATRVHGPGGMFEATGQFPSARYLEFPASDEALRYFKSGPPFLQRYLPFWAATFVDRMLVMLVPLLALLIPLLRIMPPMYRWRIRSRIYRWYRDLLALDPSVHQHQDRRQLQQCLEKLASIELEISRIHVPLSYADQLYELRVHMELVRDKLGKALEEDAAASADSN